MNIELKKAIINSIFEEINQFQLINLIIARYRPYIYDNDGNYLLGGKDVVNFIEKAIKLITNK